MADSYCNDICKVCGETVIEGKGFIAQPVTLTKSGYGYDYDYGAKQIEDGRLRIKYHGGGRGRRMVFHEECWEELLGNYFKIIQETLNAD